MGSQPTEEFISSSNRVISNHHFINIRYHRFQDDHEEPLLALDDHCYIVMDDKRHEPYLIAAIIKSVDRKKRTYKVVRINDNHIEHYQHHQIVQRYDNDIHAIDINKHKQKIQKTRNIIKEKKIKKTNKSKKRKRSETPINSEQTNHKKQTQDGSNSDSQP